MKIIEYIFHVVVVVVVVFTVYMSILELFYNRRVEDKL